MSGAPRTSTSRSARAAAGAAIACSLLPGCASTVSIARLEAPDAVEIRLDANSRVQEPGRRVKYFVDVTNRSGRVLDLADFEVEIRVLGPDARILLRQDWKYRWGRQMLLAPDKRLTVPILPERNLELPVEQLPPATYDLVAVVNGRFSSPAYRLRVARPDLDPPRIRLRGWKGRDPDPGPGGPAGG